MPRLVVPAVLAAIVAAALWPGMAVLRSPDPEIRAAAPRSAGAPNVTAGRAGSWESVEAELRQWAQLDAAEAAAWALRQRDINPERALAALFDAAVVRPDAAIELARELGQSHPDHAIAIGHFLVAALSRTGEHARAAAFATATHRPERGWIAAAFAAWAADEPRVALAAAQNLAVAPQQHAATQAVFAAWARRAPAELADHALTLPAGFDQRLALIHALRQWIARDPDGAADWIARQRHLPDLPHLLEE